MTRDARLFLSDILESIEKIQEYLKSVTREELLGKSILQDSVMRRLEIIGEATKNIPASLKEKYPEIPWRRISGLRDVLIHAYFGIDAERLWVIVKDDLPILKINVQKMLKEIPKGDEDRE